MEHHHVAEEIAAMQEEFKRVQKENLELERGLSTPARTLKDRNGSQAPRKKTDPALASAVKLLSTSNCKLKKDLRAKSLLLEEANLRIQTLEAERDTFNVPPSPSTNPKRPSQQSGPLEHTNVPADTRGGCSDTPGEQAELIARLRGQVDATVRDKLAFERHCAAYEQDNKSLRVALEGARRDIQALKEQCSAAEQHATSAAAEVASLRAEKAALEEEVQSAVAARTASEGRENDMQHMTRELLEEIAELEKHKDAATNTADVAGGKLARQVQEQHLCFKKVVGRLASSNRELRSALNS